ncbi:MAG: L-threonylcarbamoyladenylate synthase [Thermodesulfobacteriota bacterium]|nr:L-threonylcarbamoyladenylate synthase [Thermodesulfobacteriota bacterium]
MTKDSENSRKHPAQIIKVDQSRDLQKAVGRAGGCLLSGGVVAYPTESFYGLAVDATNQEAIKRLFLVKELPTSHPVLILIPSLDLLEQYVDHIPSIAHRLIKAFWPGGLSLVFVAGPKVSPMLTAGTGKIGVRLSSHPVATALTGAIGVPITGTSANISGETACRNAGEVVASFREGVDLVLDGGETPGQMGSTVLDVTVHPARILRHGMIDESRLNKFIGN